VGGHPVVVSRKLEIQPGMTSGDEIVVDFLVRLTVRRVTTNMAPHAELGTPGQRLGFKEAEPLFLVSRIELTPPGRRVRPEPPL
jgi:hypothetical protein